MFHSELYFFANNDFVHIKYYRVRSFCNGFESTRVFFFGQNKMDSGFEFSYYSPNKRIISKIDAEKWIQFFPDVFNDFIYIVL